MKRKALSLAAIAGFALLAFSIVSIAQPITSETPRGIMRHTLSSTSGSPLPCGFDQFAVPGTRFISS